MNSDIQRQDASMRNAISTQAQAILHAFDGKPELTTHEIYACVSAQFPDLSRLEHGILLGKLKQAGMIAPGTLLHAWQRLATLDGAPTAITAVRSAPIKRTFAIRKDPLQGAQPLRGAALADTALAGCSPETEDRKTLRELTEWLEEGRKWMARGTAILEQHQADR
ncbi:hypothetical protein JKG47_07510 [Acidithiobacillus sp. MC6.1]|nr:hypothetical protein [Acidithiobacillus sp. MC6.1]